MAYRYKIRLIFLILATTAVLALLWLWAAPSGQMTYSYDFTGFSHFISPLEPEERVEEARAGSQEIIGNPVYFNLYTPRHFDTALVELLLENQSSDLTVIELGILTDKDLWRYQLKPFINKTIDRLADDWQYLYDDGISLLQRYDNYQSLDEFLADLPPAEQIAVYNYNLPNAFRLADYSSAGSAVVEHDLRGDYQFFTYIKDEDLSLNLRLRDLNMNDDPDPARLTVYDMDGTAVGSADLGDDGTAESSEMASSARSLALHLPGLPQGAYKVEFRAGDDIVTERLESAQSKLSFIHRLWLFEPDFSGSLLLYADSPVITAQTNNPASRQTIIAGEEAIVLDETFRQKSVYPDNEVTPLTLSRSDTVLSGKGVFAFSKEALFDPVYERVDNYFQLTDRTNYIIAGYTPADRRDGLISKTVEFDLNKAVQEDGRYSFILSIPGLRLLDESGQSVKLHNININLKGTDLWQKLRTKF